MSAPNQLQANQTDFYSSQYLEIPAVFVAANPVAADTFSSIIRLRKMGKMVSVEIILNGVGTGVSTNIKRFDSTTAIIPLEYRALVAKYGSVMFSNTAGVYNQAGFCLVNSSGVLSMYSANADFVAGSYIQNSTFIYYSA